MLSIVKYRIFWIHIWNCWFVKRSPLCLSQSFFNFWVGNLFWKISLWITSRTWRWGTFKQLTSTNENCYDVQESFLLYTQLYILSSILDFSFLISWLSQMLPFFPCPRPFLWSYGQSTLMFWKTLFLYWKCPVTVVIARPCVLVSIYVSCPCSWACIS